MHLKVLPMLVVLPLLVAACSDDDSSDNEPIFPLSVSEEPSVRVFDEVALEGPDGIEAILVNDYKIENIESIDCPADQEVEKGNKFECTVTVGGDDPRELTVPITVTRDDGEYQVGLPEE